MDYPTKIKHAEKVADQLQEQKSLDDIKAALKAEGLYEMDIANVLVSARKMLGDKYQPKINEYLLAGKPIHDAEEFRLLDNEVIDILIARESEKIAVEERKKITRLIKEGQTAEQVFQQVDTRFLSAEDAGQHIAQLLAVQKQNSGSGRMLNIGGGIGLIVLTGVLAFTMDRIFYVLPFIGLGMIYKGLTTERMKHDS